MKDSHRKVDKEEGKGVMMPIPELKNDVIDRSKMREKIPPEHRILDTNRLSPEDEAGFGGRPLPGQGARDMGQIDVGGHRIFGEAVQMNHKENVSYPADNNDSENGSCIEVRGDEEWVKDYEKMSETATWYRDIADPTDEHQ